MSSENGAVQRAPLAALFEEHASSLKRMLGARNPRAQTRVRADKDPEDLVQEAFLCALSYARRAPTQPLTRAYLLTIARNLEIDRWRRRRGQTSVGLDTGRGEVAAVCPDVMAAEREQREQTETLAYYVENLSPPLSCVYEARFVRGLSQRDAAVSLGLSRRQLRTIERRLFEGAIRDLEGKQRDGARRGKT